MSIRKARYFPFGTHINDMKNISKDLPIEIMPAPEKVYISLSQHIGAPAIPVVNIGDTVKKGQLIGQENGFVSANIYSSVSGEVIDICDIVNGLGQKQKYIIIKNDSLDDEIRFDNIENKQPKTVIDRIRLAGIVGLGGAGFPTSVKLSPKNQLDTLLINGAECEPYLTCDYRLMIEKSEDIYKGVKILAEALKVSKIIIAIEANKPDAIEIFSKFSDIDVVVLKRQYPMGSEKHLIYCATGRKVPVGKMPFDVGVCVQNIKTVIACYEAVENNKPLTQITMTVSGNGIANPKNLVVSIGTPFSEILAYCGWFGDNTVKVLAGGPMMGKSLVNLNQYARKTDSGILCLTDKETSPDSPTNCINCAKCANLCPMRLMPMFIESSILSGDVKNAEKYGAMNCIECGLCAYNCPAKRSLVQSISLAKQKIKESKANGK